MAINTRKFIETQLKIKDKNAKIVPLTFNHPQEKLYAAISKQYREGKPQRVIVLKARQEGISTETEAIIFKKTAMATNVTSGIVAHEAQATTNLFNMFKRFYDNLEPVLKPEVKASNAKELIFNNAEGTGLNSAIKCMTAGNQSIGRSDTFQNLHISEYAFWEGDKVSTLAGLMQAVPNSLDTLVIIESTANGYDDFKNIWDKAVAGEIDFIPVFCAWWEMSEYSMPYSGFKLTDTEHKLMYTYNLTLDQLEWRRWCIKNNLTGDEEMFKQEYPSCPEEAFLTSGRPVFNNANVIDRISALSRQETRLGHFSYEWEDPETKNRIKDETIDLIPGGDIRVYEEPQHGYPYVIGGDTKGEGKDYYTATVINNVTGNRAAVMRMDVNESSPYTHQMYCLGRYYNNALIAIEMNFNTGPNEELMRLNYPNLYMRQRYDDIAKSVQKKVGWKTDGNTRPLIIDREARMIEEHIELFNDVDMLRECITFVYDKSNRPDALPGHHDDLLFSDMIAQEVRGSHTTEIERVGGKAEWRTDQWEDYRAASAEDKKMLLQLWGKPKGMQ